MISRGYEMFQENTKAGLACRGKTGKVIFSGWRCCEVGIFSRLEARSKPVSSGRKVGQQTEKGEEQGFSLKGSDVDGMKKRKVVLIWPLSGHVQGRMVMGFDTVLLSIFFNLSLMS